MPRPDRRGGPTRAVGLVLVLPLVARASPPVDWAEGMQGRDDGASRDFANRGASLRWANVMGDWRDADDTPQGDAAYAVAGVPSPRDQHVFIDHVVVARRYIGPMAPAGPGDAE